MAMKAATVLASVVLTLDQASKFVVVHLMELDRLGAIDVAPPWLNLRMAWNRGVNFGLFADDAEIMRWALVALSLAISAGVWIWAARAGQGRAARLFAGLLVGGALGNVLDRMVYGAVADFLNMGWPGFDNPWSFNVADVAIFLGAAGLVLMPGRHDPAPGPRRGR
ncbi:signal peptidase II [Phaeovulum vinaykumarii]|uniref:Lipoprotein signal peptidase n=1 Tax=Phaeovulum vinaykumarii TaxID=407234 RepID=A0A1N7KYM9_9RHOB|nr:signal peptidase II [Phaeovulum vinaykumarii]SIS66647.1 signal peptidase II [Phaeovulum vinaykumarii]SOC01016.1 signal peptidase II [Phaeovulum vinaykumarii]